MVLIMMMVHDDNDNNDDEDGKYCKLAKQVSEVVLGRVVGWAGGWKNHL